MGVKNSIFINFSPPQCDDQFLNSVREEPNNAIIAGSITPNVGDTSQLGKAITNMVGNAAAYTDSGAANAYVLSAISPNQSPTVYRVGMIIRFKPGNTNTGASTVNVSTLGVKSIFQSDGITPVIAGQLMVDRDVSLAYDGANFRIISAESMAGMALQRSITQVAHGFSVGQVVRLNGSTYQLAQANSAVNAEAVGIVALTPTANLFILNSGGYVTGLSGLTAGTVYFLSATVAGQLTATEPTTIGQVSKPVFIADSATSGYFFNFRGLLNQDSPSPSDPLSLVQAWGNFDGVGSVTVKDSFGMTSIVRSSLGIYLLNYAAAFANLGYAVAALASNNGTTALDIFDISPPSFTRTTTQSALALLTVAGDVLADSNSINFIVAGRRP